MSDPLFDQLDAIHAYDSGCVDSGVHDEQLRARLVSELDALPEGEVRLRLSRWVRNTLLSDEAIAQGYGWEDALAFLGWIDTGDYRGGLRLPTNGDE
jgi:hypothetical protein